MRKSLSVFFLSAVLLMGAAHAAKGPLEVSKIVSQQQQIRADVMAGKGRYKNMPEFKRGELLQKQKALLSMLEGKETSADLSEGQQIEAFNTLEWIEAAINNAEDDQAICRRTRTVGSNRVTTLCRTKAQMALEHEQGRDDLGEMQRGNR